MAEKKGLMSTSTPKSENCHPSPRPLIHDISMMSSISPGADHAAGTRHETQVPSNSNNEPDSDDSDLDVEDTLNKLAQYTFLKHDVDTRNQELEKIIQKEKSKLQSRVEEKQACLLKKYSLIQNALVFQALSGLKELRQTILTQISNSNSEIFSVDGICKSTEGLLQKILQSRNKLDVKNISVSDIGGVLSNFKIADNNFKCIMEKLGDPCKTSVKLHEELQSCRSKMIEAAVLAEKCKRVQAELHKFVIHEASLKITEKLS